MSVSTDDVEVALGRDMTADEETRATRLIAMAQALIEDANPGFSFDAGTETATVQPGDPSIVWTPKWPVRALTTVKVDTLTVVASDYRWNELGKITPFRESCWIINLPVLDGLGEVELTYDYGFTTVPADLALLVAAMVAGPIRQGATNADHVEEEQLGPYRVRYGDQAAAAAILGDPPALPRRWRRSHRTVQLTR